MEISFELDSETEKLKANTMNTREGDKDEDLGLQAIDQQYNDPGPYEDEYVDDQEQFLEQNMTDSAEGNL